MALFEVTSEYTGRGGLPESHVRQCCAMWPRQGLLRESVAFEVADVSQRCCVCLVPPDRVSVRLGRCLLPRVLVPDLRRPQVTVDFSDEYNRRPHPELEHSVEEEWQKRLVANPRLFNGTKFRFHSIADAPGGGGVVVRLGMTDYREFIGTNQSPHAEKLIADGVAMHGTPDVFMVSACPKCNDVCVVWSLAL